MAGTCPLLYTSGGRRQTWQGMGSGIHNLQIISPLGTQSPQTDMAQHGPKQVIILKRTDLASPGDSAVPALSGAAP